MNIGRNGAIRRDMAGVHPWHMTIHFLDWMFEPTPNEGLMDRCLLCDTDSGVRSMCCGAPFCINCMLAWWNALRNASVNELICPWCHGSIVDAWVDWLDGERITFRRVSRLQSVFRRRLLRSHFTHNGGELNVAAIGRVARIADQGRVGDVGRTLMRVAAHGVVRVRAQALALRGPIRRIRVVDRAVDVAAPGDADDDNHSAFSAEDDVPVPEDFVAESDDEEELAEQNNGPAPQ